MAVAALQCRARRWSVRGIVVASLAAAVFSACSSTPPKPVWNAPIADFGPPVFRGTIGAETTVNGIQPVLVSGYGLVVGLNGTGGEALPDRVAATMEREMGLKGIGMGADLGPNSPLTGKSPREVLRDPNVAVVLVQAAVPPGSPKGKRFDVFVQAVNASSLEGGRLFTTELRLGPPTVFGQGTARLLASAAGPIFVNPFDLGKEKTGVRETNGRVLGGGLVTEPLDLDVAMDQPSFARARAITGAINSRFPEGRGDRGPTARGKSGGNQKTGEGGRIAVRVPSEYREDPGEFLKLMRGVQIDQSFPEEYARRYVEAMKAEPALSADLSYCLEALGPKAAPFLRDLYSYGEIGPQLAAIRAGVGLGDALATPALIEVARKGPISIRSDAVRLLGQAKAGPTTDLALQEFLREGELTLRVAAYEALAERAERAQLIRLVEEQIEQQRTKGYTATESQLEAMAYATLPPGTIQGVERLSIGPAYGVPKFTLDIVPFGEPLVYITQQGRPRIVLFGNHPKLLKPLLVTAWEDRFLMIADTETDSVRVQYRALLAPRAVTLTVADDLRTVIETFARDTTPEDPRPGLGMTYSEVVGILYAIQDAGAMNADFSTERDKLMAQVLSASLDNSANDRPETSKDVNEPVVFDKKSLKPVRPQGSPEKKPEIIPIPQKKE